jgi:TDG/mug DNA glycosylase family protein
MPILPDVLEPGLTIVFCGSAASDVSAARGAYYANPQNKFWRTIHEVGLTPRLLAPEEFHTMPRYGLGLTDLAKEESGMDVQLSRDADDAAGLRARIMRVHPRILAFTAKRPAQVFLGRMKIEYGWQDETLGGTKLYVLTSPSPAAVRWWDIAPWRTLADAARGEDDAPTPQGGRA